MRDSLCSKKFWSNYIDIMIILTVMLLTGDFNWKKKNTIQTVISQWCKMSEIVFWSWFLLSEKELVQISHTVTYNVTSNFNEQYLCAENKILIGSMLALSFNLYKVKSSNSLWIKFSTTVFIGIAVIICILSFCFTHFLNST